MLRDMSAPTMQISCHVRKALEGVTCKEAICFHAGVLCSIAPSVMTEKSRTVNKWYTSFVKGTDFDSWGQLVEAADEYTR